MAKPCTPHLIPQAAQLFKIETANVGGRGVLPSRSLGGCKGGYSLSAEREYPPLVLRRARRIFPPRSARKATAPPRERKKEAALWEELRKEVPPKTFVKSAECNRIAGNFNISEDYIMDKTIFEQMGGTYHQEGDYFLPDLPPPESIPVGVWGQRRRQYLKTQRRVIYTGLLLSGKLDGHLAEIDAQAEAMLFQLVNQLAEQEGITEQLKAENQMEWVQRMNNIRNRVEEIIYNDLIYI